MGLLSLMTGLFLLLSVWQALYARFYAWPCYACFLSGRFLEVAYLTIILCAAAPNVQRSHSDTGEPSSLSDTLNGTFSFQEFSAHPHPNHPTFGVLHAGNAVQCVAESRIP